ncbi:cupin domain-containing protein [Demequina pelophila]|uniref:cupin domain-containing protein n=1 Tax=Demequina pelophila TaxID=1638984 RepID=UPI000A7E3232|nr:cupin domain-containing protein [Demequina pelophila]
MTAGGPRATVPRRVVTGHDAAGTSVVLSDGIVPVHRFMPQDGVGFYEIWQTDDAPAPIGPAEPSEPTERTLRVPPEPRGTKIRINEFFPGHVGPEGRQSPVHRTESVDYGIVLEGQIVLILDDSEVTLGPGDVVIQRGTDHAWANRTDRVCRVAFILVGGAFTDELLDLLPADARDSLMTRGPHDHPVKEDA